MDEIFIRAWHNVLSRVEGPMHFRLVIQPLMALMFAVRSGLRDAREGRPAFLASIVWNRDHQKYFLAHGWKDIGKIFIAAGIIDLIYEVIVFKRIYPLESLVIAAMLSIVPYLLVRGPVNRLIRFVRRTKASS